MILMWWWFFCYFFMYIWIDVILYCTQYNKIIFCQMFTINNPYPTYEDKISVATLIPARINKHIHYNVSGKITYQFPNFNGCKFGNGYWFHPTLYVTWDYLSILGIKLIHISKGATGNDPIKFERITFAQCLGMDLVAGFCLPLKSICTNFTFKCHIQMSCRS